MSESREAARRRSALRGRGGLVAVCSLGLLCVLALAACGGSGKDAASTSVSTPPAASTPDAGGCDTYGITWVHSYNVKAVRQGNPIRMLSACCQTSGQLGVHHCFIKLTLAGTKDLGCETVDIGSNGLPAGTGTHEKCDSDT